jgi:hypothetical protein
MKKLALILFLLLFPTHVFAAVGCDLNDPDRDVKRFFPTSTGYKTAYLSIQKSGGEILLKEVEKRLGDNFQGIFETIDVPYTIYTIFRNEKKIGYIHGVNQKSTYGGMQVFLILDTKGIITAFYIQKLTSKAATQLRSKEFGDQFVGLNLASFESYDVKSGKFPPKAAISKIKNPAADAEADFKAALRGVKKNFILLDVFVFNPINF